MRLEVFVLLIGVANLLIVLEFVRRRKLAESFALLWSVVAVIGLVLVVARPLVDRFAGVVGVVTGTSVVFSLAILFLVVVNMYLSVHITNLNERVERLTEEVAIQRGVHPPLDDPSIEDAEPGPADDPTDHDR